MKAFGHLKTISKHKLIVGQLCFKLGLYRQGLAHDLSKYSLTEFMTGARYYQGDRSPNSAERDEKGYSMSWLHHKGRNKHHWEFWVDFTRNGIIAAKMPYRYVLEMICDRIAASKVYKGANYTDASALEYYEFTRFYYVIHPETDALLKYLLTYLAEHGEDETFRMIKKHHDYDDYDLEIEEQ